jgi:cytochrome c-type biogenesis protein CcmH
MTTFIALAAALTVIATALVVAPLLRPSPGSGRAPIAAAIAGSSIAAGAALLYASLSNWPWSSPPESSATAPDAMVAQLARRLEGNPDDLEGWTMLGRSYSVLQQFPLAIRAYQRADRLAQGRNVEALTGLAEALTMSNADELDGRAGRIFEQVPRLDPRNPKALYYSALAALRTGKLPLARERFQRLLDLDPPDNIKPILLKQIAVIDAQMTGATIEPAPAPQTPHTPPPTRVAESTAVGTAVIRINLALAPSLAGNLRSGDVPLFVFVRSPGQKGPPLAAKRLSSRFPQSVELTPADAMLTGRSFTLGQDVEVVARVARSGSPTGASGDPYGLVHLKVGQQPQAIELVIDRLTP